MKNKIRIIDLLNMIANNEAVPVKIQVNGIELTWIKGAYWDYDEYYSLDEYVDFKRLNDEVEILDEEEHDELEEFEIQDKTDYDHYYLVKDYETKYKLRKVDVEIIEVLNKAIKHIKRLEEKK